MSAETLDSFDLPEEVPTELNQPLADVIELPLEEKPGMAFARRFYEWTKRPENIKYRSSEWQHDEGGRFFIAPGGNKCYIND